MSKRSGESLGEGANKRAETGKESSGLDFSRLDAHKGYYELAFSYELSFSDSDETTTRIHPTFIAFLTRLALQHWDERIKAARLANDHTTADQLCEEQFQYDAKIRQRLTEIGFNTVADLERCEKEGCGETDPEAWEYMLNKLKKELADFEADQSLSNVVKRLVEYTRQTYEQRESDCRSFDTHAQNFINEVAEIWSSENRVVKFDHALARFGSVFAARCNIIQLTDPIYTML